MMIPGRVVVDFTKGEDDQMMAQLRFVGGEAEQDLFAGEKVAVKEGHQLSYGEVSVEGELAAEQQYSAASGPKAAQQQGGKQQQGRQAPPHRGGR